MIRFVCLHCQERLKLPDRLAGTSIRCPFCKHRCHIPEVQDAPVERPHDFGREQAGIGPRASVVHAGSLKALGEEIVSSFPPLTDGTRLALLVSGGVCVVGLLLGLVLRHQYPEGPNWTVGGVFAQLCFVAGSGGLVSFLLALYGHGTSCPRCESWWAREDTGSKLARKERLEAGANGHGGPPHAADQGSASRAGTVRYVYEELHQCKYCGHRWSTTATQEEKEDREDAGPKKNFGRFGS
jgi:hypothetical protein